MHNIFKMAKPSKAILDLTIPYIGALTALEWKRWRSVAEVGGGRLRRSVAQVGGGRLRSVAEVGGGLLRRSEGGGRRVEAAMQI